MAFKYRSLELLAFLVCIATNPHAVADTPLGWVNNYSDSAYTTTANRFEVSLATLRVNDTIDFLDVREELLVGNRALVGKSGDLKGSSISLHYGLLEHLSLFGRVQQQQLTAELGEINSLDVIDIDTALDTSMWEAGFKWVLYEADLLAPNNRHTALSIEAKYNHNESDSYDVLVSSAQVDGFEVIFANPQTFAVDRLEDEGWSMRLRYSTSLGRTLVGTIWAGYGENSATAGTSSDLASATIASYFEQQFDQEETYYYAGLSLNAQFIPRLPLTLSYEYIRLNSVDFSQVPETPPSFLPRFLTGTGSQQESANHTLKARMSYWITPRLHVSLLGNLFANQFVGLIPHYNNPLTGSFSSLPYGYIGVELGINGGF